MGLYDLYMSGCGRINRKLYWLAALPLIGLNVVLEILLQTSNQAGALIIAALLCLALIVASTSITIKRLHDRDKSGWFMLIGMIPLIGGIWLMIETGFLAGTCGANRFGPDPLAA